MAKILILRLTSLGDVIFTLPLVNVLKDNGHEVDYLVSEKGYDVVKNHPSISKVHLFPLKEYRKSNIFKKLVILKNTINNVRKEKYDIALDCQQMFKSLILFAFSGAKRRITFRDARELSILGGNEFIKPKTNFRDFNYHIVERNLDFARYLNIEPKEIKFNIAEQSIEVKKSVDILLKNIDTNKKTIVIAPETTWKNKHWNISNWEKLVKLLNGKYNLVFTGLGKFPELCNNADGINLFGKTNLNELTEVFNRADLIISPDSGSSNSAWSCGHPAVISIFTCTPSKRFGPYGNDKKYFSVQGQLPCQPCFKKKCRLKNLNCTFEPPVDEIIKIVNSVLS